MARLWCVVCFSSPATVGKRCADCALIAEGRGGRMTLTKVREVGVAPPDLNGHPVPDPAELLALAEVDPDAARAALGVL
jgi:hypothetical protein